MEESDKADKIENSISNIEESDFEINKMQQEKQMYNSEYKRGHDDGIIAAENRCYENGFRDGVQFGVEVGYHVGFMDIIRRYVEKNCNSEEVEKQDKILQRMKSLLDKYQNVITEGNDLDEIKKIYKILTSSMKSLSRKLSNETKNVIKINVDDF